uniref:methyl-accepting chemotaxis protein n=1 Tax=Wolinella succinogenes TaxID=844 RepID=UPI0024099888
MFKSMSIGARLALVSFLAVFFSLATLVALTTAKSFESAKTSSDLYLQSVAQKNSAEIGGFLSEALESAEMLAQILEGVKKSSSTLPKGALTEILLNLVEKHPHYVGAWIHTEKNAFYPDDPSLAGDLTHSSKGRFMAYAVNDPKGARLEPASDNYETEAYYALPKKLQRSILTEPYVYPIAGKEVTMTTLSVPVFYKNDVIAVVGVDISLEKYQENIDKLKIFDTGYGILISQEGILIAHPNLEARGKNFKEIDQDPAIAEMLEKIKNHQEAFISLRSFGKTSKAALSPIKVDGFDHTWGVAIVVPEEEIYAQARHLRNFSLLMGTLFLILICGVMLWFANSLTRRLNDIKTALAQFFAYLNKEGDRFEPLAIRRDDEIGTMAQMINENVARIESSIEKDSATVQEALQVVEKIKGGSLKEQIHSTPANPELKQLCELLNEMLATLKQGIAKDLNQLQEVLSSYAKMDFTPSLHQPEGKVEQVVQLLGEEIKRMLTTSQTHADSLQKSSTLLKESMQTLSQGSNEQAASLQQSAAAIEEMSSSMHSVNDRTSEVIKQ